MTLAKISLQCILKRVKEKRNSGSFFVIFPFLLENENDQLKFCKAFLISSYNK